MSVEYHHPLGPQAQSSTRRTRRFGCGRFVFGCLAFAPFALFLWFYLAMDRDLPTADEAASWVEETLASFGIEVDPAADGGQETQSVELDSGQIIEGDVQVLTLDQVRERSGLVGVMNVAIEEYPDELRRLLEDEGVDPNMQLTHRRGGGWAHPLEKAVRQGTQETFEILLAAGADPNGQSSSGDTAMHWAAHKGYDGPLRQLIEAGGDPNISAVSADQIARHEAGDDRVPLIGDTVLERGARYGQSEIVDYLLRLGVDLRYALHAAAWSGSVDILQTLLDAGADATARNGFGEGPLRGAAEQGHLAAVELLLGAGAVPSDFAVRQAANGGHGDVLRAFAANGVSFDRPPEQWDPLYTAAYMGHADTVRLLLELGAELPTGELLDGLLVHVREEGHGEVEAVLAGG